MFQFTSIVLNNYLLTLILLYKRIQQYKLNLKLNYFKYSICNYNTKNQIKQIILIVYD